MRPKGAVVATVLSVLASLVPTSRADFLADYLSDKTFGPIPGPCPGPTINDDTCFGDTRNLPESAKKIEICLIKGIGATCGELGDVVTSGEFTVWDLQCYDGQVADIVLDHTAQSSDTEINAQVDVQNFKISCTGSIRVEQLTMEVGSTTLTATFEGSFTMIQPANVDGITLSLGIDFFTETGFTLNTELPETILLPYDKCDIEPDLNLELTTGTEGFEFVELCSPLLFLFGGCLDGTGAINYLGADFILGIIVRVAEGIAGGIVCQIIEEAAWLEAYDAPGIINEVWAEVKAQVDEWGESVGQDVQVADSDAAILATEPYSGVNATMLANAINYRDSTVMESVSVMLNNWLGSPSVKPEYEERPVINELISLLTEPDGTFPLDLEAYDAALEVSVPLNVSNVTARLQRLSLQGLNTLSTFKILNIGTDVPYEDRLRYTFNNSIVVDDVTLEVEIYVRLDRGSWVTKSCNYPDAGTCSSDSSEFTFNFTTNVQDVDFGASMLALLNPDEIVDLQVGQILDIDFAGESFGAFSKLLRCVSPAAYALNVTNVVASLGAINDPQMVNFDGVGLSNLIQGGIELGADVVKGALKTKFPGIINGPVRELVNEILLEEVTLPGQDDSNTCPPWQGPSGHGPLEIDFDGAIFSPVYALINDSVGGERIRDTEVDLNEFIDELLKFNEESYDSFPFNSVGRPDGEWGLNEEYNSAGILASFSDENDFIQFSDFVIGNLDSLYKLTLSSPGEGLDIGFGLGGALLSSDGSTVLPERPLELSIQFQAVVPSKGIDEAAILKLSLSELDIDVTMTKLAINIELIYALYISQLDRIPCLLAALNDIQFEKEGKQASISALTFEVTQTRSDSASPNKLEQALSILDAEQPDARAQALVTTLADVITDLVLDVIEGIPAQYANLTAETCVNAESDVDLALSLLSLDVPNVTETIERCTAEIEELESVEDMEIKVFQANGGDLPNLVNFKESFVFEIVRYLLDTVKGPTLQNVFTALGNTSGNALSDLFELDDPEDPENGNVTFVFPIDKLNLGLDYSSEDPGFRFNPGYLRVKSVNRLLETFEFLKPLGTMTTQNRITFRDDLPLDVTISPWIELDGEAAGEQPGTVIREEIDLAIRITDLNIVAELVTAFDYEKLLDLTLSQLLAVQEDQSLHLAEHALDCWLSTYYDEGFFIRKLNVTLGDLSGVTLTSTREILSEGMEEMVGAIVELVAYFYASAVPRMLQNCAVPYVNDVMFKTLDLASCPNPEQIVPPPLEEGNTVLRFDTSPGLNSFLSFWFEDVVSEDYAALNTVLDGAAAELVFLNSESSIGDQSFNFTLPLVYNGVSYGTIFLELADVKFGGLGTFRDLRPLVPFGSDLQPMYDPSDYPNEEGSARRRLVDAGQQPYTTQTDINIEGPLSIEAKVTINAYDLFEGYPEMINELNVKLSVYDVFIMLQLLLQVDLVKLMDVRFRSFSTLNEIPCLLIPVEKLEPLAFNFNLSAVEIEGGCAGTCDFPLLTYLEDGSPFTNDAENQEEISKLVTDFVDYWTAFVGTKGAQQLIDGAISQAEDDCAAIYELVDDLTTFTERQRDDAATVFAYIFLGGCGVAAIGALLLIPLHRRRQKKAIAAKLVGTMPFERDEYFAGEMALTELRTKSIFQHPITPLVARFLIPFVQLMNVTGLVVAIGFSEAANIIVSVTLFGATTQTIALVPFTLFSTINDTWNSGAWPLAVLIAVASCMWPIIKNLILMFLWFAPTTIVSAKRRRFILEVLDMLGKWSFLDVFVIVITLAALRSYVVGAFYANVAFLDDEVFITDVNVTPESGLVLLCFVAALSLVVNHIVMFYHDRVEESNQRSEDRANGNHEIVKRLPRRATVKYPIWKHEFSGSSKSGFTRVVDPIKAKIMVGLAGLSFLLVVIGIWLPLITFELRGLIGLLLEVVSTDSPRLNGQMLNSKTYSVIEMGAALAQSPTTNGFEVVSLTFFKILYAIATYIGPIILFIMMTVLFLVPVNLNTGKSLFFWTKIASYWSGLEIFLVAMVLTIMEISIVTQFITDFITNDVCSQIVGALEVLVEEPDLDAFCFNAVGILQPTSVLLFVGVALELTCFYIITVIAHAVLADRYYDAYKGLRSDVKPHRMLRLDRFILTHFTTLKRTAQRPSRGAVDPSAPPELAGGVGPFTDLDNQDDNELIDHEDMWCAPCNRCCANEKGQRTAEARIDAWQSRFAVASNVHRRESGNPAFGTSGGPPPARFRSNSIDV